MVSIKFAMELFRETVERKVSKERIIMRKNQKTEVLLINKTHVRPVAATLLVFSTCL